MLFWPEARHRHRRVIGGRRYELDIDAPQAVVEYDGSFSHRTSSSFSRDMRKTLALLDAGLTVVRVREKNADTLPLLPMSHPRLVQLTHVFGSDTLLLAARIAALVEND